jgi:hypothetical protein
MITIDADGTEDVEQYAGVVCAAKRAGTTTAVIRSEAKAADDARRAAYRAWSEARFSADYALSQRLLDERGLRRSFAAMETISALPEYVEGCATWDAANPAPEAPAGWR